MIFYVTSQQFALFTQELAQIAEQTFSVYGFFPYSKLQHLECMNFIMNKIITSNAFSEESLKIIGRSEMSNRFRVNYAHHVNGQQIHDQQREEIPDLIRDEPKVLVAA